MKVLLISLLMLMSSVVSATAYTPSDVKTYYACIQGLAFAVVVVEGAYGKSGVSMEQIFIKADYQRPLVPMKCKD